MLRTLKRGWIVRYPRGAEYATWIRDAEGTALYLSKPSPRKITFTGDRLRATAYPTESIAEIEGRHMGVGEMETLWVDLQKTG